MSKAHLVTGATGFVGGALVLELLRQTEDQIVCLARPRGDASAEERLHRALRKAATAYDAVGLLEDARTRISVLEGSLTLPACGVDLSDPLRLDEVWHAAASLAFEDENRDEIFATNVGGTEAVVDLARAAGATTFNYVSTAYVAGATTGTLYEVPADDSISVNNEYERSKITAERLVTVSGFERLRILRPSIVIGHSVTRAVTSYSGLYGFIRGLRKMQYVVGQELGAFLDIRQLRIHAHPDAELNFIPIDAVAEAAIAISLADGTDTVYHLTNSNPPKFGPAMEVLADLISIRTPRFVEGPGAFTTIDEAVDEGLLFYGPYIRETRRFDRTNTDRILANGHQTMPADELRAYMQWYNDFLTEKIEAAYTKRLHA